MWLLDKLRRNREVIPPVNVRLVFRDGTELPVDCRYIGQDPEGFYQWETVRTYDVRDGKGLRVAVDMLPGKTEISIHCKVTDMP